MGMGRNKSGSELGYILGLSPVAFGAPGSGNPFPVGQFTWGTLVVAANSAGAVFNVEGSIASNGTFAQVGASIQSVASGVVTRSFALGMSQTYLRLTYDNNNAGSVTATALFVMDGARRTPINQHANTTVLSNVL